MPEIAKFIIDTNIIFSALYNPVSNAGLLIDLALEEKIELYAPQEVRTELLKNLKEKLELNEHEIKTILYALPVKWLDNKLYENFIKKAEKNISKKDAPFLAAHYLTKFPIITGDKEFFKLKNIKIKSLREIIDKLKKDKG
ncbi:MAG: putative toxin-antitoxin system toxin component, PIN family [Candidatus Helarchaeota archaeon]